MEPPTSETSKTWLHKLKEESWEAELLVSAVAIFGTFQLFGGANWLANTFIDVLLPSYYFMGYIIVYSGLLAISMLVAMFVIHFILRSYWVGLVGLNSVFPNYGLENSAYSKIYTQKLLRELPELKTSIERVDELCSVIFSSAFATMMIYTYAAIMFGAILLLFNYFSEYIPFAIGILLASAVALLIVSQVVLSAIANLERNRENERLQTLYFLSVKYSSILFLGPLYKANMQITMTFGSNYKQNKNMMRLLFIYVAAGVVLSIYMITETNVMYLIDKTRFENQVQTYADFYADQTETNEFILFPQIAGQIIKQPVLQVFIPIMSNEKRLLDSEVCQEVRLDKDISKQEKRYLRGQASLKCYQSYHRIDINGEEKDVAFTRFKKQKTGQYGIVGFVPLDGLSSGDYHITITKQFGDEKSQWQVPFYYTATAK